MNHFVYGRWKKQLQRVTDPSCPLIATGKTRKLHPGPKSTIDNIAGALTHKVFALREQGLQVNNMRIRSEASKLSESFKNKPDKAKKRVVQRYIKRQGLSYRVSTHVAQKHHKETEMASKFFISMVQDRVAGVPPESVLNMDQTPIYFSFHEKRTLAPKGQKTIHILASTNSTQRATLNVAVTLAGTMVKPMTIFKGKTNGTIAMNELPSFPTDGLWACQEKAWCNEAMMHMWIDGPLVEWKDKVTSAYPNVIPIVVLDSFKVHMMGTVVARIQSLGMEVIHIPAGCTYLCQPVDVGINRPIKHRMAALWEEWMVTENSGTNKPPPRKLIAQWIIEALNSIDETTIKNAWKKKGFEWVL
jgi:hypothetical protein